MKMSIVLFLFLTCYCFAQTVELSVVDAETDKAISKVNLFLNGKSYLPQEKGEAVIVSGIRPGDTLAVTHAAYNTSYIVYRNEGKISVSLTPKLLTLQSILVQAYREKSRLSGMNAQTISSTLIEAKRINEDFPQLLQSVPSVTSYSEGGDGTGYNYLSIRGFDQRRILIAVNGVPQNDPEDHNVYWIDFNDLAANSGSVSVQRGAGFALSGYPAIGGAVNIVTKGSSPKGVRIGALLGGNNLRKYELSFSSGVMDAEFSVSGRVSHTLSTGYRELSWVNLASYYFSILKKSGKLLTQINLYGARVNDGLVYTGLPKFAVTNEKFRKLNYSYWEQSDGKFGYTTPRRAEEQEQFSQPHFEILNEYETDNGVKINSALFGIWGKGHFDYDGSWAPFSYYRLTRENGFTISGSPDDNYSSNALIRAKVENFQFGFIPKLEMVNRYGTLITGAELRFHNSIHWGSLISGSNLPIELTPEYRYYQYRGRKDMAAAFIHQKFTGFEHLNLFAEVQVAYHRYKLFEEKYIGTDFSVSNIFINPRAGINYSLTPTSLLYLSLASVGREPRLKNYYDAAEASGGETPQFEKNPSGTYDYSRPLVQPERLFSIDAGYTAQIGGTELSINGYLMRFRNEIVRRGQLDRFGNPTTGNMPTTLHLGLELSFMGELNKMFRIQSAVTVASSRITEGSYFTSLENGTKAKIDLNGNSIAGFPSLLVHVAPQFISEIVTISTDLRYSGKFYSDNFGDKLKELNIQYPGLTKYPDNVNDAYFVCELLVGTGSQIAAQTDVTVKFKVQNVFNTFYSQHAVGEEFFPAAERTYSISIIYGF